MLKSEEVAAIFCGVGHKNKLYAIIWLGLKKEFFYTLYCTFIHFLMNFNWTI